MSPRNVIAFDADSIPARDIVTDDPAVVDVPFTAQSRRHFTQAEKGAFSGIWEAPPHRERVDCDYDEMCHLLEGRVRLTDADGQAREFGPGESFVVARGFKGTWENLTHVRKVFFILS